MATPSLEAELHRLHPHLKPKPHDREMLSDGEMLPYQREECGLPPEETPGPALWLAPLAYLVFVAVAVGVIMWAKSHA